MKLPNPTKRRILTVWMAIVLSVSFSRAAEIVERKGLTPVGEIIFVAGKSLVRLVPEESYRSAVPRQVLVSNDIIKTTASAPEGLMIETPYATAAIRGTDWFLFTQTR